MADAPVWRVPIPLRCHHVHNERPGFPICGRLAAWRSQKNPTRMRLSWRITSLPGDEPIARGVMVGRVSIVAEIVFAAASMEPGASKIEAVGTLERGVQGVGGVLNLHVATCRLGYQAPP